LYGPAWSNHIEISPKLQTKLSTKSCLKKSVPEILLPIINSDKQKRENDVDLNDSETASLTSSPTTPTISPTNHRKIQFNDSVEQCIAVDNEDGNDDDGIEMNISTICKLAPTKLKEDRIHMDEYFSLYSISASWNYYNSLF
jgi:hypothetical protein